MEGCYLCPRDCGAKRGMGERGYCGETSEVRLARAALHFWEEPCISGERGSGTVFFTGCNLGCVFCQNRVISGGAVGKAVSVARLAEIFGELAEKGAHNLNLVTPTHYAPQIIEALRLAKRRGITLPVVYNTGGYEKPETLQMLEGLVDIYLPDFKYMDSRLGKQYSGVEDYPEKAKAALEEMFRQAGEAKFDAGGMMEKGVIVRHLVLPSHAVDSRRVVQYLHQTYGDSIYISIMNQYTPVGEHPSMPELGRKVTQDEYGSVVDYALAIGVENGFIQEGGTAEESFIPAFSLEGV